MSGGAVPDEHDYGYDLAHEMKAVARLPRQRRPGPRPVATRCDPREPDPDTDFGHDLAHEL